MRLVVQRVSSASVEVDGNITGKIDKGFFVLVGVEEADNEKIADKMISKLIGLRIFSDSEGKTNLSIQDVGGNLLLVSQFTLYADCRKGNRPSFIRSGSAEHAEKLYDYVVDKCKAALGEERIGTGIFGASMKCSLVNEGPFTIILDSEEICR
jgi:D-tyrosyl-tRNA(Tyr) deacylase